MAITQDLINELISCAKRIIEKPSPWKLEKGTWRMGCELEDINKKYFFTAFGRYNEMFNENFSFGLIYCPKDERGQYEMIRCNGPHGEHRQFPHHIKYHIHKATEQSIAAGLKEDGTIELTDGYTNHQEALRFFLQYINVKEDSIVAMFPPRPQSLFD
jgi:hypothetical protein